MLERDVSEGGVIVGEGERRAVLWDSLQARGASRAWRKHSRLEKKNNLTNLVIQYKFKPQIHDGF